MNDSGTGAVGEENGSHDPALGIIDHNSNQSVCTGSGAYNGGFFLGSGPGNGIPTVITVVSVTCDFWCEAGNLLLCQTCVEPIGDSLPTSLRPTPPANNGTCGITVKCRGIEYGKLGKLGFQHCDAQVTDSSGAVWSLSGGPQPYGDITALNAWAISPPTDPFTGTSVYQGNSCSAAGCMIQSTQAWNKDIVKPIYSATSGPNSNTWLKGTAAGCGVSLPINTWGSIW
jgi:hypothetical protein